jgi:hypothetical protein
MSITFLLLQLTNLALAATSIWIHFRNPQLWDDQAMVMSACAGALSVSLTAIILGVSLVFREEAKWGSAILNLFLALAFGAVQGYFLFLIGRDMGIAHLIKARLGLP